MPTLPSGLEVAVDPAPLRKLLLDYASPFNAHHVMALQGVDDLFRWFDVLILRPCESLSPDERATARPAPDGMPSALLTVPAGFRLADWRTSATAWSAEDRAAFAVFIEERIRPVMAGPMANVRERQETLLKSATFAGAFACMWRDRIHPLQDEADD